MDAQQAQAPGQLRPRPGTGRQPEWPAPPITEYKPKSTLVVPEHPTPRAKFPVIDIHSHQPTPISPEQFDQVVGAMDRLNIRVLVNLSGGNGERLRNGLDAIRASRHAGRMVLFANVDFRGGVGAGFGLKAATQLEQDVKAGALGLKIFKDLGLRIRKADGTRLPVDDPELDAIWEACARLKVPVLIHTGSRRRSSSPSTTPTSVGSSWRCSRNAATRQGSHRGSRNWWPSATGCSPSTRRRPSSRRTWPITPTIWRASARCWTGCRTCTRKWPRCSRSSGASRARHAPSSSSTRTACCSGRTATNPTSTRYHWRTFETADEYFDYYRDYHAFWKLYGMELPDEVLRKLYSKNALRLVPGLPKDGFPQ